MPVLKKIRIGTRASKLALIQAEEVKNLLQNSSNIQEIEIVPITTSGDKILDKNLASIGGKGLFIKELEEALLANKIDLAVHSAKDVPPACADGLVLAAFTKRIDPHDAFISEKFNSISQLPNGAVIGTSSARRKAFLLRLRSDLKIVNFRGNIETRLKKVAENQVDGTILAVAGLVRANLTDKIKEIISPENMLPAGGQGCLAIQVRENDPETLNLVKQINNEDAKICLQCERAFLQELGASCVTPVGAFASIANGKLHLKIAIIDFNGTEIYQSNLVGEISAPIDLGKKAATITKTEASELLKKII